MQRPQKPNPQQPEADKSVDTLFVDMSAMDWHITVRSPGWRPPTDVFELEDMIVVRMEIAGMRDDNFSIELNGRYLTIRGVRQDVPERRAYHQMEIRFGEFNIEIELPFHVDPDLVEASYSNGFLRVLLPRSHPRQIQIKE
jgi:HSP20 family protein